MTKKTIIKVKNLSKNFKVYKKPLGMWNSVKSLWHREYSDVNAVNNISFEIKQGEVIGFIGQNGAGKTTTLKMLSGLIHPTSGEVSILGYNPWNRQAEFQKQFSLIMAQKNQLWWDLPAVETFDLNRVIYNIPKDQYTKTLNHLTKLLKIKDILHIQVRRLSLGQRMKCELVAALLHRPKILFLDEPTIGLDVVMQETIREFIKKYNEKYNATIILTSHYMGDVEKLCKRIIVINQGKIVFDGPIKQVIDKYAKEKRISAVLTKKLNKKDLSRLGKITKYDFPQLEIITPRNEAAKTAAKLLQAQHIDDLNIQELPIETIIQKMFKEQDK